MIISSILFHAQNKHNQTKFRDLCRCKTHAILAEIFEIQSSTAVFFCRLWIFIIFWVLFPFFLEAVHFFVLTSIRTGVTQAHAPLVWNCIINLQVWRLWTAQPMVWIHGKKKGYFCPPLSSNWEPRHFSLMRRFKKRLCQVHNSHQFIIYLKSYAWIFKRNITASGVILFLHICELALCHLSFFSLHKDKNRHQITLMDESSSCDVGSYKSSCVHSHEHTHMWMCTCASFPIIVLCRWCQCCGLY